MRVILIQNPTAGAKNVSADSLISLIRAAGHDPIYQSTKDPQFPDALYRPADLIVVAGGDGTVTKIVSHLPTSSPAIAILPLGTANNIAASLGIAGTPEQIIPTWDTASRQRFDLWVAKGPWNHQLFLEGCGLGILAQAAARVQSQQISDAPDQELATAREVLRQTILQSEPLAISACLDGQVMEGRFLLLEVLNIGIVGPKLSIAPDIDPTDSWLDVAYVGEEGREALLEWLDAGDSPGTAMPVSFRRCQTLQLSWQESPIRIGDHFWTEEDGDNLPPPWQAEISLAPRSFTVLTTTNRGATPA